MKDSLETCNNCVFKEKKFCNNLGSVYYDKEVAPNSTCTEWESKLKW